MVRKVFVSGMLGLLSCLPTYATTPSWMTEVKWEPVFYAPMAPQAYFSGYASSVDIARETISGDGARVEAWVRYIWSGRANLPNQPRQAAEKAIGEVRHLTVDCRMPAIRTNLLLFIDAWPLKIIPPKMPAVDSDEWADVFRNYGKFGERLRVDDDSPDGLLVASLCMQDGEIQRRPNSGEEQQLRAR